MFVLCPNATAIYLNSVSNVVLSLLRHKNTIHQESFVIYYITINLYVNQIHYAEVSFESMAFFSIPSFTFADSAIPVRKSSFWKVVCGKFKR